MPTYTLTSVIVRRPDADYPLDARVTTTADCPALAGASAVFLIIGERFGAPHWMLTLLDSAVVPFTLPIGTRLQISGQTLQVTAALDTIMALIREEDTE